MNRTRIGIVLGFVLGLLLSVFALPQAARAQNIQKVDQGKPGTQGPWPVTGTMNVLVLGSADGGVIGVVARPVLCNAVNSAYTTMTLGAAATALTPSKGNRAYVVVCTTVENSGTPIVRCRADGTNPTTSTGSAGDVMTTGDCLVYPVQGSTDGGTDPIACIASASSTYVSFYQCVP